MDKPKLSIIHLFVWFTCYAIAFALSLLFFAPDNPADWTPMDIVIEININLAVGTSLAAIVFFISRVLQKQTPLPYPGVWLWYLAATLCLLNNSLDASYLLEGNMVEVIDEQGNIETEWNPGPLNEETSTFIRILSTWAMLPLYWLPILLGALVEKLRLPIRWMTAYGIFAALTIMGAMAEFPVISYEYPGIAAALIWLSACALFGLVYLIDIAEGLETGWPHFIAMLILVPAAIARTYWAIDPFIN